MATSSIIPNPDSAGSQSRWIEVEQVHYAASKTFDLMVPKLSLPTGRLTALIGANGSGKSTLLSLLTNTRKAQSGQVKLGGSAVDGLSLDERDRIGVQLQDAGFNPQYSVRRIVSLHKAAYSRSEPAVFAHFGVPELGGRRFSQLSSGQRQRLQLALALAHAPVMALFDEPTSNLDALYEQRFVEGLLKAREQNSDFSALFVTHAAGVVDVCDDVVVLVNGRIEAYAEKNALVSDLFGALGARFEGSADALDHIEKVLRERQETRRIFRRNGRLAAYGSEDLRAAALELASLGGLSLFSTWKTGAADILESFKND